MTFDDDDLERRLRSALTRPRPSDRVDADTFLARVHRGARVRRVKRGASVVAAAVLVLGGGAAAVDAVGFLDSSQTPAAGRSSNVHTPPTHPPPTTAILPAPSGHSKPPQSAPATQVPSTRPVTAQVTIATGGPIAAGEVTPLSLTATGTMHQWVLADTPGRDCAAARCATVFTTADHGVSWADLGQLPALPATSDSTGATSISQLRFAKRDDGSGIYDGWAYGGALWSTHDSGRTWSAAGAPAGQVTQLEAWGGYTYAGVSSSVTGHDTAVLYRTPTSADDWQPVDVGTPLTSVTALAAANGVVGLVDSAGPHSVLYLSRDGQRWQRQSACPAGTDPAALSTAGDATSGVGALWVTCANDTSSVVRYTDTTALGSWHDVSTGALGAGVRVAAKDPRTALLAGATVPGIEQVSPAATPSQVYAGPVGTPVFFGFTNPLFGYLLSADGSILGTTDGGGHWAPYAVSDTTP